MPAAAPGRNLACAPLTVPVGGVRATLSQLDQAAEALEAWPSTTIKPVLVPLGNPLAQCDYHAVAAPYKSSFPSRRGQRGASGQPSTKLAFICALRQIAAEVRQRPALAYSAIITSALSAFGADERYAAEMAREAVKAARSRHQAAARARLRSAVHRAVSACEARQGEFTCTTPDACGTGGCRFAAGVFATLSVEAVPGRMERPANHAGGGTFDPSAPLGAYLERCPFTVSLRVSDRESARSQEHGAAL